MSTVHEIASAACTSALSNSWAVELPKNPTFPAAVFEIDTQQEDAWCMGGGYDQHVVQVVLLYHDFDAMDAAKAVFRAAFEALPEFMFEEANGDADYEDDPSVYGFFMNFRLRTPRY